MESPLHRKKCATLIATVVLVLYVLIEVSGAAYAQTPLFSASSTLRESKKITAISSSVPFSRTYAALAGDSSDLTFQELSSGRLYLSFASFDSTMDDLFEDECTNSAIKNIFWVDKGSNLPGVCLTEGATSSSSNPRIGGPEGEEGRYVAFETLDASPLVAPSLAGAEQVVVHDRKWDQNYLSRPLCLPAPQSTPVAPAYGGDAPSRLWDMSDDGQYLLFTTASTNMRDNLTPVCSDNGTENVYLRDGANCDPSTVGACFTAVLYDSREYHAGENQVSTLDAGSQNVRMTPDHSKIVFDTAATVPNHYSPDTAGFKDIYYSQNDKFSRISQTMLPLCSPTGEILPLTNEFGAANGDSERPSIDESGRFVAFESDASDMVVLDPNPSMVCSTPGAPHPDTFTYVSPSGHRQIYLYDKLNKRIEMITLAFRANPNTTPQGANGDSSKPRISRDGRFIVFESKATNLLQTATTAVNNIFLYDRYLDEMFLVTPGTGGSGLNADANLTHISKSGLRVAFETRASDTVNETASQGGVGPMCGGSRCQQVYLANNNCPLDTDGDQTPDCIDSCPNDVKKTEPKQCGCGNAETDTDADLTPDCVETCDNDPNKTAPGVCGCGVADTDSDGDGTPNCADRCPADNSKTTTVGSCGCGVAETDTDLDGSPDCIDSCPADPLKIGKRSCPCGALKSEPGQCGCNVADTDANGNGQADCLDLTPTTQPTAPVITVNRIGAVKNKSFSVLRARLQNFGGQKVYFYKLTRRGFKFEKTSTTSTISVTGLPAGTYLFSYYVTSGTGARKITTKTTTVEVRVP
jgi:Tol biopolymer transport system component